MTRKPVAPEDRELDPRVVGLEACTPHDDSRVYHSALALRHAKLFVRESPNTDDPSVRQRALINADTLIATMSCSLAQSPAEPRVGGRARHEWPNPVEQVAPK